MNATPEERSREVFEEIAGYEKPPLPPLPDLDDYASLARQGFIRDTPTSRRILRAALRAVGYERFHRELPTNVEAMLRTTNMREARLFAPAFSATTALADDPRGLGAIARAATLVVAAQSLAHDIMSGKLTPDMHRGATLEMGQYPNLFSTSALIDGRVRLFKSKRFDRVGVLVRRRVYILDVGDTPTTAETVAHKLHAIVADARALPVVDDASAPGIVTAAKARTLTRALRAMYRDDPTRSSLDAIRDCFFVLCLDLEYEPPDAAEVSRLAQAANPANRWYLQSMQIVVTGNAKAAVVQSFLAYLDGNVQLRSAAELWQRASKAAVKDAPYERVKPESPRALDFRLGKRFVKRAWKQVRAVQDPQTATFTIRGIGRQAFKARGIDPVGAFVAALAYATKRASGRTPDILQLLTISKYRCVPVGAAMVTTRALHDFVDTVERDLSREDHARNLRSAIDAYLAECRMERDHLSLRWPIEAFVRSRRGFAKGWTLGVFGAAALGLAATRSLGAKDVVISHPSPFDEIPIVGRPGVRLPYVNCYGLHYTMYESDILLTFMPGPKWCVPNALFVEEIERAIHRVLDIAGTEARA